MRGYGRLNGGWRWIMAGLWLLPAIQAAGQERATIAVFDFKIGAGLEANWSLVLTDEVRAVVQNAPDYRLVTRDRIKDLLTELDFSQSADCDQKECAVRLGEHLSAQYILIGRVEPLDSSYHITVRLFRVQTGEELKTLVGECAGDIASLKQKSIELGRCAVGLCGPPPLVRTSFENGAEGWRLAGNGSNGSPMFDSKGSDDGACLSAGFSVEAVTGYFVAGPQFKGNFSPAVGGELRFDLKTSNQGRMRNPTEPLAVLKGGGLELSLPTQDNPSGWNTFAIPLSTAGGWRMKDGKTASESDLRRVLTNLSEMRIRGDFALNHTGWIDNVALLKPVQGR